MAREWTYRNAPLIEVIAELRWKTVDIRAVPNASLDPQYEAFNQSFSDGARNLGLIYVENLVPDEVPREFLAGQPCLRVRSGLEKWPLFQIGPGLFTANVVPPYKGWSAFSKFLSKGLKLLGKSYPAAGQLMTVSRSTVRYINGFDESHGNIENFDFMKRHLDVSISLGESLRELRYNVPSKTSLEIVMPRESPMRHQFQVKMLPGQNRNRPILAVELAISSSWDDGKFDPKKMERWFGDAHKLVIENFEAMTSEALKEKMGPKDEVG